MHSRGEGKLLSVGSSRASWGKGKRSAKEVEELDDECKGVLRANFLEFAATQTVVAGRSTE